MAEELLQALTEEVRCHICLDLYDDPRVLECQHSFCRDCAFQMRKNSVGRSFIECPLCRHVTFLGASGVNGLKKSHNLANIADKLRSTPIPDKTSGNQNIAPATFDYPIVNAPAPPPAIQPNHASSNNANRNIEVARGAFDYSDIREDESIVDYERRTSANRESVATLLYNNISSFIYNWFHANTVQEAAVAPINANVNPLDDEFLSFAANIGSGHVPALFEEWVRSLWLPPSDLFNKIARGSAQLVYIPFWMYDVTVTTTFTAKIVRNDPDPHHGARPANEQEQDIDGTYDHNYPQLMICAPSFTSPGYDRSILPLVDQMTVENHAIQRGPPPIPPAIVWTPLLHYDVWSEIGEKVVERKERERCEGDIMNRTFVSSVKELILDINFLSVRHRLVHVPFYVLEFTYENLSYKWVCCATSGEMHGNRPYGLGKLGQYGRAGIEALSALALKML